MEVRLIDPKTDNDQNAGRVQGTVIRVIHPKHSPAPSPYRFLIKRALNQDSRAGKLVNRGRVLVRGEPLVARKETETELSDAGEQGWIGDSNLKSERLSFVGSVTSEGIPAASPDSHHAGETGRESFLANSSHETDEDFSSPPATNHQNAEIVRTDSRGSPRECQSAPSYPAPNHQNAEVEGHTLFLLRKTSSEQTSSSQNFPPPASAPESQNQNAGNSEKFVPPGMESRSPCASRSSKPMEVIVGSHKFFSPFGRFLSYVLSKSAFNDPSREMTCFGWRKKA
jgi:hypothetical protein